MSANSTIEWTDATWNPVRGCSRVSEGCRNCYAEGIAVRFSGPGMPFEGLAVRTTQGPKWTGKVRTVPELLELPLRWRKPRRIFVNSMSDLFHEDVPDEFIDLVFKTMWNAPKHTFQVLTKRPKRMLRYLSRFAPDGDGYVTRNGVNVNKRPAGSPLFFDNKWPLPNVWLGVSVEDQAAAYERIPLLLQTPSAVRFLSVEPLLGQVHLPHYGKGRFADGSDGWGLGVDWVICGGESGPGARPMHPDWARSLRDQCQAASVPFFFKQWGEWSAPELEDSSVPRAAAESTMYRIGKKAAGRLLDGRTWDEFPP
jgi:protein gp37